MTSKGIKVGQTWLTLVGKVNGDITGCTAKIKYKKPNDVYGEWNASITDYGSGIMTFSTFTGTTLDVSGDWILWIKVTRTSDSVYAEGDPVIMKVVKAGISPS